MLKHTNSIPDYMYTILLCPIIIFLMIQSFSAEIIIIGEETLTGVTQLKIGDVCLLACELASETVLGVDNAKSGICYIYVCMYGWYVCSLNARAGTFFS